MVVVGYVSALVVRWWQGYSLSYGGLTNLDEANVQ
jgi:hypothetical protein